MAKAKQLMYVVVGAGDFAVDKVKNVRKLTDPKYNERYYNDFLKRGRSISTKVRNSGPGKQITAQTDTVKEKATDAAKQVTKALGVNVVSWPTKRTKSSTSSTPKRTTAKKTTKSTAKKTTSKAS